MFSKHFQGELQYLREVGRLFGEAHPESAGLLVERGGDPDVERLLEGFAFLTARIRERVDDAVPEIVGALAELLLPQYARTLPACSIVEFVPTAGSVRARQRVPRGAEVSSGPVDGTTCRFRTTADVDLLPLVLVDVTSDRIGSTSPTLSATFQTQGADAVFRPEGFRLYLHAEPSVATTLLLWFARHLRDVVVTGPDGAAVHLGPDAVRLSGFDAENSLFPWPRLAPTGHRLLQEYLVLPLKFLFLDLVGLDRAASVADERFEVTFHFDRPPDLPGRVGRDVLRLFCSPVVNLFSVGAEPIPLDVPGKECLLRAASVRPAHMEVFSVDAVTGIRAGRAERVQYSPFFDYSHSARGGASDVAYYRLRRQRSTVDEGIDVGLSILTPRNVMPALVEETLSIDLTCTNRSLPTKLRAGDISTTSSVSAGVTKVRNITGVTRPLRPPLGSELHWRLLSHLALNVRSLADVGALRSVLALYNSLGEADEQASRSNRLRIEGIVSVAAHPARRLLEGAIVRGVRFEVELDERSHASRGDAFLFSAVLDELLAEHVTMNSFTELAVKLQPSQAEYAWTPRSGRRAIV